MGRRTGDQARYNKLRRKKIARRVAMRAFRADLEAKPQGAAAPRAPRAG